MMHRVASGWGESERPRRLRLWLVAAALTAAAVGAALVVMTSGAGEADAQAADPADLSVEKSDGPDPVVQNQVLTYTLAVENAGPDPATNVMVEDKLPNQVDLVSVDTSTGNCEDQGRNITCELGTLASGATATVTIQVRPKKDGSITNTASVESDVEDPQTANNEDSQSTTVSAAPEQAKCRNRQATIVGTSAGETLTGTNGRDVIKAGGGDDQVNAGGGKDVVCAGGGNDLVRAGGGNDFAKGQGGGDVLKGSRGGDTLKGNRGRDNLKGGRGNDLLAGGKGRDRCKGGGGRDTERSC
jgi:uncharacterized repeat protein (TIGR01451 family)